MEDLIEDFKNVSNSQDEDYEENFKAETDSISSQPRFFGEKERSNKLIAINKLFSLEN